MEADAAEPLLWTALSPACPPEAAIVPDMPLLTGFSDTDLYQIDM